MTEISRSETFGYLLAGPSNKSAAIGIREPHPVTFEGSPRREAYSGSLHRATQGKDHDLEFRAGGLALSLRLVAARGCSCISPQSPIELVHPLRVIW
jgi:hypothetical protein